MRGGCQVVKMIEKQLVLYLTAEEVTANLRILVPHVPDSKTCVVRIKRPARLITLYHIIKTPALYNYTLLQF